MIVIDSSAVLDLLGDAAEAQPIRRRIAGETLHAPYCVDAEVFAVIQRKTISGQMHEWLARKLLIDFKRLPITRWRFGPDLQHRALEIRHTVSPYDAPFVTLAETLQWPLVTRDGRTARSHGHEATIELL